MADKKVTIIKGISPFEENPTKPHVINVAAYCRVSTDEDDQLKSYQSQVKYYTEKIKSHKGWYLAGIYADEGISGMNSINRAGFMQMIEDCRMGKIDLILTKSISRFSRNVLDTIDYVRELRDLGIRIIFEEEKIDTLNMESEFLLTVISAMNQQEVFNTSAHVKAGLRMKMQRGEIVGASKFYGYDYNKIDKTLSINEKEADVVRKIFRLYIEGVNPAEICRRLRDEGIPSPRNNDYWLRSTITTIIKNVVYKGDLLQGKSYTVSPLTKQSLKNFGEKELFLVKKHHEAIIPADEFEQAQRIMSERCQQFRLDRFKGKHKTYEDKPQDKFTMKIKCFFCGRHYTKRKGKNIVSNLWSGNCRTVVRPYRCISKQSLEEKAIEDMFVDSYNKIFKDNNQFIDSFIKELENYLKEPQDKLKKEIRQLDEQASQLLDVYLDGKMSKDDYYKFGGEIKDKQDRLIRELNSKPNATNIEKRLLKIRNFIKNEPPLKFFRQDVFDKLIEQVIVGGLDSDGKPIGHKITFVFKTGDIDEYDINGNPKNKAPSKLNIDKRASENKMKKPTLSLLYSKPSRTLSSYAVNTLRTVCHKLSEGMIGFQEELPYPFGTAVVAIAGCTDTAFRISRRRFYIGARILICGIKERQRIGECITLTKQIINVVLLVRLPVRGYEAGVGYVYHSVYSRIRKNTNSDCVSKFFLPMGEFRIVLFFINKC